MLNGIDIILIHLLNNITQIDKRLAELNMTKLQRYVAKLSCKQEELLAILDQETEERIDAISEITVLISRVYKRVPRHLRAHVFQDYEPASELELGLAYAPKAEVEYFCKYIEPLISVCQETKTDINKEEHHAYTTSSHHPTKVRE